MDGLSAATTVVSVLQIAYQVNEYIKTVRGAEEDRRKLLLELTRARGLLATLVDVSEDVEDDMWSQALQNLDGPDGPLETFKALLEDVLDKMGIERYPNETPHSREFILMPGKSKLSKLMGHHTTPSPSNNVGTPPNSHSRTIVTRAGTAVKDLKWPFTQPHVQEMLNTLERIKTHFLVALSSDNIRLSKLIHDELGTVRIEVGGIKDYTSTML